MNQNRWWQLGMLAAVIGLAAGVWRLGERTADAEAYLAARPTAVAVIDLGAVLQQLEERDEKLQELQNEGETRQVRLNEMLARVEGMQSQLEALQGLPQYESQLEEFIKMQASVRTEQEVSQAVIALREKQFTLSFFNKIRDAAQEYAQQQGYDIVLVNDANRLIPLEVSTEQMQGLIATHRILHADSSIDITDEVAQFMNARHQAGGGGNTP